VKLSSRRCLTTDKWIKKCGIYTQWNFIHHKENEILVFKSKWRELEKIMLSEISQAQKVKIICSPSYADFT
jgi:hypothetical protein